MLLSLSSSIRLKIVNSRMSSKSVREEDERAEVIEAATEEAIAEERPTVEEPMFGVARS
jgi:hypothetical protein